MRAFTKSRGCTGTLWIQYLRRLADHGSWRLHREWKVLERRLNRGDSAIEGNNFAFRSGLLRRRSAVSVKSTASCA